MPGNKSSARKFPGKLGKTEPRGQKSAPDFKSSNEKSRRTPERGVPARDPRESPRLLALAFRRFGRRRPDLRVDTNAHRLELFEALLGLGANLPVRIKVDRL